MKQKSFKIFYNLCVCYQFDDFCGKKNKNVFPVSLFYRSRKEKAKRKQQATLIESHRRKNKIKKYDLDMKRSTHVIKIYNFLEISSHRLLIYNFLISLTSI